MQGLELGLLVGVFFCALHFAHEYSVIQLVSFTVTASRGNAQLPLAKQRALAAFRSNMLAVSVSGVMHRASLQILQRCRPQGSADTIMLAHACTLPLQYAP